MIGAKIFFWLAAFASLIGFPVCLFVFLAAGLAQRLPAQTPSGAVDFTVIDDFRDGFFNLDGAWAPAFAIEAERPESVTPLDEPWS